MEIANLVLEYVKALSWPLVVLILILLFRNSLRKVLERKSWKLNVLGNEFEVSDEGAQEYADKVAGIDPDIPRSLRASRSNRTKKTPTLLEASFQALVEAGISDPTLKLFLGVFKNDAEQVKSALEQGADPSMTDKQLLEKYAIQLAGVEVKEKLKTILAGTSSSR